jgi:hypothetical protein
MMPPKKPRRPPGRPRAPDSPLVEPGRSKVRFNLYLTLPTLEHLKAIAAARPELGTVSSVIEMWAARDMAKKGRKP